MEPKNKKIKLNKGSYLLLIEIKKPMQTKIGDLGLINFDKGYYIYVGSAMNNLKKRVERHLNSSSLGREKDRKHWHIDYLLSSSEAEISDIYYKEFEEKEECSVAEKVKRESFHEVKGFGSSDCKCESHLFKVSGANLKELIKGFIKMKL